MGIKLIKKKVINSEFRKLIKAKKVIKKEDDGCIDYKIYIGKMHLFNAWKAEYGIFDCWFLWHANQKKKSCDTSILKDSYFSEFSSVLEWISQQIGI